MSHRYFQTPPKGFGYWMFRVIGLRMFNHYDWIAARRTFFMVIASPFKEDSQCILGTTAIYSKEFPLAMTAYTE